MNVSATGALVRTGAPFLLGRQCPLILNLPVAPVTVTVRVVRAEPATPARRPEDTSEAHYLVGVMFTEFQASAKQAIARLCGSAFSRHE